MTDTTVAPSTPIDRKSSIRTFLGQLNASTWIGVFIVLLFVAFVYVWRRGALEWK